MHTQKQVLLWALLSLAHTHHTSRANIEEAEEHQEEKTQKDRTSNLAPIIASTTMLLVGVAGLLAIQREKKTTENEPPSFKQPTTTNQKEAFINIAKNTFQIAHNHYLNKDYQKALDTLEQANQSRDNSLTPDQQAIFQECTMVCYDKLAKKQKDRKDTLKKRSEELYQQAYQYYADIGDNKSIEQLQDYKKATKEQ